METPSGKSLDGLANIAAEKWFAAMGLIGLILFVTSLVANIPTDRYSAGCIGLIMMGFGFGQTECRTFQIMIVENHKFTKPVWRLTFSGFLMFAVASGASVALAAHHFWPR